MSGLRAVMVAASALVLTACGDTGIHSGLVIAKHHEDGYMHLLPVSTGKTTTMIPEFVPAKNTITVRDCSQHHDDGSCFQADIDDPANFDQIRVGDTWSER